MRKAAVWVLGLIVVATGLVTWYFIQRSEPAKAPEPMPAPPVHVAPAPEPEPEPPQPAKAGEKRVILCIRNAAVEQPMVEECEV